MDQLLYNRVVEANLTLIFETGTANRSEELI